MSAVPDSIPSGNAKRDLKSSLSALPKRNLLDKIWAAPARLNTARTWPVLFVIVAGILYFRVSAAIRQPNFFAEDGVIFFKQQYEQGFLPALFTHYGGYLDFVPRFVAAFCSLLPLESIPRAYAVTALVIAAAVLTFFFSAGFRPIVNSDSLRAVIVIIFTLMPNSESLMKVAFLNWYMLALVAFTTIFTLPRRRVALWLFFLPLGLAAWSNPAIIVCLPVIVWRAWEAKDRVEKAWWALLALVVVGYPITAERPPGLIAMLLHDPDGRWALIHALGYRIFCFFFLGERLSYPWSAEGWKIATGFSFLLAGICVAGTVLAVRRSREPGNFPRIPLVLFYLILSTSAMFVLRTNGWHFFLNWNVEAWDGHGRYFFCSTLLMCILCGVIYERVLRGWIIASTRRRGIATVMLLAWLNLHQLGFHLWAWHPQVAWQSTAVEIRAAEARVQRTGGSEKVRVRTCIVMMDFDLLVRPRQYFFYRSE